jgi:hypothetical protein
MKKLVLTLTVMALAATAYGQGQINFSNRAGSVDAPVFESDGTTLLSGANYMAMLYAGPQGTAEGDLTAMGAAASFNLLPGYFFGSSRTITGVAGGSVATLQIRVWDSNSGATWETAAANARGASPVFDSVALTEAPATPPNLVGMESFSLVPEPSTIALGLIGAVALVFARRRK